MRNTGWYIPYWRKPMSKKKGKSEKIGGAEVWRNDEQLDAVRQRWVERYRRTARALNALGLSVGSSKIDVQARYDTLRAQSRTSRDVEDAYRYLQRVLPQAERRRKRPSQAEPSGVPAVDRRATFSIVETEETVVVASDGDETIIAMGRYASAAGMAFDDEDDAESFSDDDSDDDDTDDADRNDNMADAPDID
jgi:hypothetical protein